MDYAGKKIVVIGAGAIAQELIKELGDHGLHVNSVIRQGSYTLDGKHHDGRANLGSVLDELNRAGKCPDAIFVAISNIDNGQAARDYLLACSRRSIHVITCEKRAIANFWHDLVRYERFIHSTASVGGGTGMLPWLDGFELTGPIRIDGVLNGSINLILSFMYKHNVSFEEAWDVAVQRKCVEPGAKTPYTGFRLELVDVVAKTALLYNRALATKGFIDSFSFGRLEITDEELSRIFRSPQQLRLVVSFARGLPIAEPYGPNLQGKANHWQIVIGFRDMSENLQPLVLDDVGNGLLLTRLGQRTERIVGEGAGPKPTVHSMLADFERI